MSEGSLESNAPPSQAGQEPYPLPVSREAEGEQFGAEDTTNNSSNRRGADSTTEDAPPAASRALPRVGALLVEAYGKAVPPPKKKRPNQSSPDKVLFEYARYLVSFKSDIRCCE